MILNRFFKLFILFVPLIILLALAVVISYDQSFIGYFGDAEMQIWQSNNLGKILFSHSSILNDSFYGTPYPYALSLSSLLQNSSILVLLKTTSNVFLSYNISLVSFLYLNFLTMYWVLRKMGLTNKSSLLGGIVFFFAPSTILHAFGHPSVYMVFIIPLMIYALYLLTIQFTWKRILLASFVVALSFYIHEYYAVIISFIYAVFLLIFSPKILRNFRYVILCILSGILILLLISPFLKLYSETNSFIEQTEKAPLIRSIDEMKRFSARPLDYLIPPNDSLIYGSIPYQPYMHLTDSEQTNYLGIINISILLYVVFLLLQKNTVLEKLINTDGKQELLVTLILSAVVAFILSLGPELTIFGKTIPLPIYYLQKYEVFPFTSIRAWGRYGIVIFTIVTMLSVYILDKTRLQKLLYHSIIFGGIVLIILIDQLPTTYLPTHHIDLPQALTAVKEDPQTDTYALTLPFSVHYGGLHNSTAQLFQVIHGKPIVNGYASFLTSVYKDSVEESPIRCLHYPQLFEPSCVGVLSVQTLRKSGVKYIIYEKQTAYFIQGAYSEKLDQDIRNKTMERIHGLNLTVLSDNTQYTVYQVFE